LVGGQTRMPNVQERVTQLFGRERHKGVNPDESSPPARRFRVRCSMATSRESFSST
jgi:hypothetical protein